MSSYCSVTKVQLIIFIMGAEVVAFSSYAAAAAGALPAAVGGALVGAASERLALRRPSLPRLPPPAARAAPQLPGIADRGASPHMAAAWGATVRTAAAYRGQVLRDYQCFREWVDDVWAPGGQAARKG